MVFNGLKGQHQLLLMRLLAIKHIMFIALLFSITAVAVDKPSSYSGCLQRYITEDTSSGAAKILQSYCKDEFPIENPIEDARCTDVRKLLSDWDAYVAENFNKEVLAKQRAKAGVSGLISGGTSGGASKARENFDRQLAVQLRDNQKRRMRIVSLILESGC